MQTSAHQDAREAWDVLVLGAGMAGLGCARLLAEAGLRVCIVEAAQTVGGRVRTDRTNGEVMELGAEFVHGRPPELLALIAEAGLTLCERSGAQVRFERGRLVVGEDDGDDLRFALLEQLREFTGDDVSLLTWLERSGAAVDPQLRESVLGYVEGFNAADAGQISARSLGVQQAAEDAIDGQRVAHVREGYDRVPEYLAERVRSAGGVVRCGVTVTAVRWGVGRVAFETSAGELVAERAVLTLPLGVVQRGDVAIVPEPVRFLTAARQMLSGSVCRFTMLFRERFWETLSPQPAMQELSFLFDFAGSPSVWWTTYPEPGPVLTGWIGGPRSRALLGLSAEELRQVAVRQVARIFGQTEARVQESLIAMATHDWTADSNALGAYSYVGVGGLAASARMSEPIEHTLFFAGEHTDTTGHWGTVHGALRSGVRAARQVLEAV